MWKARPRLRAGGRVSGCGAGHLRLRRSSVPALFWRSFCVALLAGSQAASIGNHGVAKSFRGGSIFQGAALQPGYSQNIALYRRRICIEILRKRPAADRFSHIEPVITLSFRRGCSMLCPMKQLEVQAASHSFEQINMRTFCGHRCSKPVRRFSNRQPSAEVNFALAAVSAFWSCLFVCFFNALRLATDVHYRSAIQPGVCMERRKEKQ